MEENTKNHILIAEDEPQIREIWEECLAIKGFTTFSASNGLEAINVLKANDIELVITDIRMPVADGFVLLEYIKKHQPELNTITCSAFSDVEEELANYNTLRVIQKPFDIFKEIEFIQEVLSN